MWSEFLHSLHGRESGGFAQPYSPSAFKSVASPLRCFAIKIKKRMEQAKNAPCAVPLYYFLKEVGAVRTVILPGFHAAAFETCAQNRMGTDHFGRASLRVPFRRAQLGNLV